MNIFKYFIVFVVIGFAMMFMQEVHGLDYGNQSNTPQDTMDWTSDTLRDMVHETNTDLTGNYISVYIPVITDPNVQIEIQFLNNTTQVANVTANLNNGWYVFDVDTDLTTNNFNKVRVIHSNTLVHIDNMSQSNYDAIYYGVIISQDQDVYDFYNEVIGDSETSYQQGVAKGYTSGYNFGYNEGKSDYFTDSNSDTYDDTSYNQGKSDYFTDSNSDTYDDTSYTSGYGVGYNEGVLSVEIEQDNYNALIRLPGAIAGTIGSYGLFIATEYSIFGVTALMVLLVLFMFSASMFVLKKFF